MKVRLRLLALTSILVGLLVVSGATAAKPRLVRLIVVIHGNGVVRVNGNPLACSNRCRKTFFVGVGAKVALTARPGAGWAFSAWSGGCRSVKATCVLRVRGWTAVTGLFLSPGSTRRNPIPLDRPFAFDDGWSFAVRSATIDATAEIVAIAGNQPPPPGAQYTMLNLAATYTGGGHSSFALGDGDVGHGLAVIGAHGVAYGPCSQQLPPPVFDRYEQVNSGQTISGNVCFQIASNDAASLILFSESNEDGTKTWFALR